MTIGERLDQLLKQHGLTQSAFAALVGMSQQGISKIKRGEVSEPKTILSIQRRNSIAPKGAATVPKFQLAPIYHFSS